MKISTIILSGISTIREREEETYRENIERVVTRSVSFFRETKEKINERESFLVEQRSRYKHSKI